MILYSNNCVKCKLLEKVLQDNHIEYTIENDIKKLIDLGFKTVPVLQIDDMTYLHYEKAINYILTGGLKA